MCLHRGECMGGKVDLSEPYGHRKMQRENGEGGEDGVMKVQRRGWEGAGRGRGVYSLPVLVTAHVFAEVGGGGGGGVRARSSVCCGCFL